MINLNVRYLPDEEINNSAIQFLKEHNENSIPLQIEELVEFKLKKHIVSIFGLQSRTDIVGFTSKDFSTIYVDEYIYYNVYPKYRFTLAHELGHFVLHQKYFDQLNFTTQEEWINIYNNINIKDHGKLEYQAYAFGGLILVPKIELRKQFLSCIDEVTPLIDQAKSNGLDKTDYISYAVDTIARLLSPTFEASIGVITRRILKDNLHLELP